MGTAIDEVSVQSSKFPGSHYLKAILNQKLETVTVLVTPLLVTNNKAYIACLYLETQNNGGDKENSENNTKT